jgi:hypothetical protein
MSEINAFQTLRFEDKRYAQLLLRIEIDSPDNSVTIWVRDPEQEEPIVCKGKGRSLVDSEQLAVEQAREHLKRIVSEQTE